MKDYLGVFVLLVLATAVTTRVIPQNNFEAGLLKVIEKCRDGNVQSLPIAFPSLTPLNIPAMNFDYGDYIISISSAKIKGLENLSVEKLSATPSDLKMSLEIFVPTLAIRADRYHLKSNSFWFWLINSKGSFKSHINNLKVRADAQFAADGANTVISALDLDYSVEDVQAQLSGSSQIVNDEVNKEIANMINDSNMTEQIKNVVIDLANGYLQGHTPEELVKIISSI